MVWERKSKYHWVSGQYTINAGRVGEQMVYMAYYRNEFIARETDPAKLKKKCAKHAEVMGAV